MTTDDSQIRHPQEQSRRIILFCDLRDSTDIMLNYEHGRYQPDPDDRPLITNYSEFLFDFHKTSFEHLYLDHQRTHTEIYGDGLMAIFPEDNTRYILENVYELTARMRHYNITENVGISKPAIDMGFGLTVGNVSFSFFHLDQRYHPIGTSIHEAARIEALSRYYDARVLISEHFYAEAKQWIERDPRFGCRFIDRVRLKGFRDPISIYELFIDNDPRFKAKEKSIPIFKEAYQLYCDQKWGAAKDLFLRIYLELGLGIGEVMSKRCDLLYQEPPVKDEWDGVWKMKNK